MAYNGLCDLALAYISNLLIDTKTMKMIGKKSMLKAACQYPNGLQASCHPLVGYLEFLQFYIS